MNRVNALLGVGLSLGMGASWGATVVVGTPSCSAASTHALYSSIQTAIDSVPSGSTIEVCPGTYPEQVTINAKTLTIKGVVDKHSNSSAAVITVPAGGLGTIADVEGGQPIAAQVAVLNGGSASLSALTVDGSNNNIQSCAIDLVGVLYQNSSGSLTLSSVVNQMMPSGFEGCQGGLAVFAQTDGQHNESVTISNNSIENFDKNGITAHEAGLTATISNNSVTGIGSTDLIAQNGIEVAYGAGATVSNNRVADMVYSPNTYGSSGILLYLASQTAVTGNTVTNTQYAVAAVGDGEGHGDNATIENNVLQQTQFWDAIDLCASSHNQVSGNDIRGTGEAAIHVEGSTFCGTPSVSNSVGKNTINAACAGILTGPGSLYSSSGKEKYYNVVNDTLATQDDTCPTGGQSATRHSVKAGSHAKVAPLRPQVKRGA